MCNRQGLELKVVKIPKPRPRASTWETVTERENQRAKLLTCARSLVRHQCEPWLTATLVTAFGVGAEGFAAAVHYAAFVDVYEEREEHQNVRYLPNAC